MSETYNILSIDLDILMSPYCGIYNSLIFTRDRESLWRSIETSFNTTDFNINIDLFTKLSQLIINCINNQDMIYIGYDHSSILNAIHDNKEKFNNYSFNIYNIDYHHDYGYSANELALMSEDRIASCACWVKFLQMYGFLNEYYWYNGIGSTRIPVEMATGLELEHIYCKLFEQSLDELLAIKPDLVYIAQSYPWMPPHTDMLTNKLLNIIPKEKQFYYPYAFSPNCNRIPFLSL